MSFLPAKKKIGSRLVICFEYHLNLYVWLPAHDTRCSLLPVDSPARPAKLQGEGVLLLSSTPDHLHHESRYTLPPTL